MPPSAVVFDLDETLAVPERNRQTLLDEATAEVGARSITRSEYLDAHDASSLDWTRQPIFTDILDDPETAEAVADAYCRVVNDALTPVDGAESLLADLQNGLGYRVGVLTDGPVRAQRSKLETLGWGDDFDASVVTGELPVRKPHPDTFYAVLDDLDVAPGDAVYVGDDPRADIEGATNAGLDAVQVLFDGGPSRHPRADASIERETLYDELPALLESL